MNLKITNPLFVTALCIGILSLVQNAHAETLDVQLQASFDAGALPGLHGAIVDLADQRLAEIYFIGEDERWGDPLGVRQHGSDTLHKKLHNRVALPLPKWMPISMST